MPKGAYPGEFDVVVGRRARTAAASVLVLSLGIAACEPDAVAESEWAGTVRDSAGARIVQNPSRGRWAKTWTLREDVRLDPDPGPEEAVLGRPVDALEAPDGSILVLDQIARDVKVYGPDGAFSHVVSRPGEGPGELGPAPSLWAILMAGDTVLVPDPLQGRVSRFSMAGDYLGLTPLPQSLFGVKWERDHAGKLLVETSNPFLDPDGVSRRWVGLLRYETASRRVDTVEIADPTKNLWGSREVLDYPLLVTNPVWAPLGEGLLAWGGTDRGHLDVRGPSGGLRLRITHPAWEPRSLPTGMEAQLRERYRAYREELGPSRDPRRKDMHLGQETSPTYTAVFRGPDGTLWVQRALVPENLPGRALNQGRADRTGSGTWDVFDEGGVFLGSMEFPRSFRVLSVRGRRILGVTRDSLGLDIVRRMLVEG